MRKVTAVILAGGLGTRLRPVVSDRPKVLALVGGRPFLAHLLEQTASAGIERVVLCTGYLGRQVKEAFGNSYGGMSLSYSEEAEPLGTGGALRLAAELVRTSMVLAMNGDTYCTAERRDFLRWHEQHDFVASLLLTRVEDVSRYGRVVTDEGGHVLEFVEKDAGRGAGWVNAGVYLTQTERLFSIGTGRAVSLEREVLPAWMQEGLGGYRGEGGFIDIGTPRDYGRVETFFRHLSSRRESVEQV